MYNGGMNSYSDDVYVFDLDGVITNPSDSSVDEVVLDAIYTRLAGGAHIAVNTGRSYEWVGQNLVGDFKQRGDDSVFERLFIVCEKGGESMIWRDGDFVSLPSRFALNQDSYNTAKELFESHADEFPAMFWDATKRTMATIEKKPEAELQDFKEQQKHLGELLHESLNGSDVKVDLTTIATDIESPRAGKHAGAELIYEWVAEHTPVEGDIFTCFGDSPSDYEMARYFGEQGARTTFVFVGKPEATFDEDERVRTVRTTALYAAGTREYFEHNQEEA